MGSTRRERCRPSTVGWSGACATLSARVLDGRTTAGDHMDGSRLHGRPWLHRAGHPAHPQPASPRCPGLFGWLNQVWTKTRENGNQRPGRTAQTLSRLCHSQRLADCSLSGPPAQPSALRTPGVAPRPQRPQLARTNQERSGRNTRPRLLNSDSAFSGRNTQASHRENNEHRTWRLAHKDRSSREQPGAERKEYPGSSLCGGLADNHIGSAQPTAKA
jgi:hypothetical protein